VLQWLRAQHPPCPWDVEIAVGYAEEAGFDEMLEWLQQFQQ